MGKIKGPKVHALTMQYGSHQYNKSKYKDKSKSHAHSKKGTQNPSLMPSDPKGKGKKRGQMLILP
jgi:hypothetical protein